MNKSTPLNTVSLRRAQIPDLDALLALFCETIRLSCAGDYSPSQIEAWASGSMNRQRWTDRIGSQYFLVAETRSSITGFASLEGNYVDVLYVRHDCQGRGIARLLYTAVEQEFLKAKTPGEMTLETDASITARPFFEKMGFALERENLVKIRGVELKNFRMVKVLSGT